MVEQGLAGAIPGFQYQAQMSELRCDQAVGGREASTVRAAPRLSDAAAEYGRCARDDAVMRCNTKNNFRLGRFLMPLDGADRGTPGHGISLTLCRDGIRTFGAEMSFYLLSLIKVSSDIPTRLLPASNGRPTENHHACLESCWTMSNICYCPQSSLYSRSLSSTGSPFCHMLVSLM
jgi:hypothetical protein